MKTFVQKFARDWSTNLAAMLTYHLIVMVFPILLAALSVAGMLLHAYRATHLKHDLAVTVNHLLPRALQSAIGVNHLLDHLIQLTGPLAVVSLLGLLLALITVAGAQIAALSMGRTPARCDLACALALDNERHAALDTARDVRAAPTRGRGSVPGSALRWIVARSTSGCPYARPSGTAATADAMTSRPVGDDQRPSSMSSMLLAQATPTGEHAEDGASSTCRGPGDTAPERRLTLRHGVCGRKGG